MRDVIVILTVCAAAIILGAALYFFGPESFRTIPVGNQQATPPIHEPSIGPVAFVVIDEGTNAVQVTERKNFRVNGVQEFDRLWTMVYGETSPPAPSIDFTQYDAIAVFMGEEHSGGHAIAVSSIEDTVDARVVHITVTEPGDGCVVSQALTSPYQIVRVPISGLPLTKVYTEEIASCE